MASYSAIKDLTIRQRQLRHRTFFTSGCVLRMSRFLRRRFPFTRGRQALFDVVRKRGTSLPNLVLPWQKNCGKYETLRLNLKKIRFVVRFCMKCNRTERGVFCKQPQTEWRDLI